MSTLVASSEVASPKPDDATPDPLQQFLVIGWPNELRFYERRLQLLRSMVDADLALDWDVGPEHLAAKLSRGRELQLSATKLTLSCARPSSATSFDELLRTVLTTLEPRAMTELRTWFQHVLPLDSSYDDARRRNGLKLFGHVWPRDITDFALLVDGPALSAAANYQVEFGIVSRAEIPKRLARTAGRVVGPRIQSTPTRDLPDVAVFTDSNWSPAGSVTTGSLDDVVMNFVHSTFAEAQVLAGELWRRAQS